MMYFDVNGHRVAVYTGGQPLVASRPCVVLVHGALHDHSVFTLLARWLAHHGFGVLALDLPGHGRSTGPALASVEDAADWLLALLDAAGVQRAALAGHSMGSLIALEAAARAPERATQLVLIGSAFPMKVSPALLDTARQQPLRAIDMVNSFSISSLASKPSFPGPGLWLHGSNRALMRRVLGSGSTGSGCNLFEHDFRLCDAYAGGLQAAQRVRCPTTMLLGRRDQMTPPKAAQALATALRAEVVLLDSGHHLMAEQPDALLHALRQALQAAPSAASSAASSAAPTPTSAPTPASGAASSAAQGPRV